MSKRLKNASATQGSHLSVDPSRSGGSTQNHLVQFSFRYFHEDCLGTCAHDELIAFSKRLKKLSAMTWQQVHQSDRHALGSEKIPRDQLRVPCLLSEDVTEVLSFRYGYGMNPMLGHREGAVLHVLWVSHGHEVYAG